jgi:hypothetical protein
MTSATVDGNEAAASVAYRLNEVCCIYPITPSSPMAGSCAFTRFSSGSSSLPRCHGVELGLDVVASQP